MTYFSAVRMDFHRLISQASTLDRSPFELKQERSRDDNPCSSPAPLYYYILVKEFVFFSGVKQPASSGPMKPKTLQL